MVKFKSYEYDFDQNIIDGFKEKILVSRVGNNEEEKTVEVLKSQLGNDAKLLDSNSDLVKLKESELIGVRDNKETELVFYCNPKEIFFQIEPSYKRLFGMYTTVKPYVDIDGKPDTVNINGIKVYNFGWSKTEQLNQDILKQKKQQCEDICTMKKCKDTHKLVSIEDVKKNIEQNNPNFKLVDNNGEYLIHEATTPYSTPGGRRTIKKNKKKKSTRRKTKRIIIKKKKLNKGKKSRKN
jgi:hypothetical protein